ncbi:MAG TPA: phosphate ABC transporter permease subunit PstC, partial [Candidatus Angelobacter sp.]|nr:phosphate ABC transporter permease subunit PstC [Candidatus Angelobacter sp.]
MSKSRVADRIYKYLTAAFGAGTIIFIVAAAAVLVFAAYPSIRVNGLEFLTKTTWNPNLSGNVVTVNGFQTLSGSSYGILVFVADTLASSAIAVLLAVPAGLGIAIFLTQIAPRKVAAPISLLVEMLAGIPSVIYGFWGLVVLGPYLLLHLEPFLSQHLSFIPIFSGPVYSPGLLAAGIILAIMVVPIIASISRDMMTKTPNELKEGAKALGLTRWEVTRKVVLPFAKTAIFGSIILGLGRALGETMAIAMLSGAGVQQLPTSLYYPASTVAAFMVLSLNGALSDPSGMGVSAL